MKHDIPIRQIFVQFIVWRRSKVIKDVCRIKPFVMKNHLHIKDEIIKFTMTKTILWILRHYFTGGSVHSAQRAPGIRMEVVHIPHRFPNFNILFGDFPTCECFLLMSEWTRELDWLWEPKHTAVTAIDYYVDFTLHTVRSCLPSP
jgi:hypothetical protein